MSYYCHNKCYLFCWLFFFCLVKWPLPTLQNVYTFNFSCRHTLLLHSVDTPYCHTLLTHPIVTLCWQYMSLHFVDNTYCYTLLTISIVTLYWQYVLSTCWLFFFCLVKWPLQTLQRLSIHSTSHVGTLYCYTLLTHPIVTLCWHTLLLHFVDNTCRYTLLTIRIVNIYFFLLG
jgi:hypothetical protein